MTSKETLRRTRAAWLAPVAGAVLVAAAGRLPAQTHVSGKFEGVKANAGTVSHLVVDGRDVLTLSNDFVVPDTPAPHWQVVDSTGRSYLLQRLEVKDEVYHQSIVVPAYVRDLAKVQIWCAFAETLLGEASFGAPILTVAGARMPAQLLCETAEFAGVKANRGRVGAYLTGSQLQLTMSEDFVVPDAPAPHWQVVDSKGNAYLLQRMQIKGGAVNKTITVPAYVPDVVKVQCWCAFAEVLLGEAEFDHTVALALN